MSKKRQLVPNGLRNLTSAVAFLAMDDNGRREWFRAHKDVTSDIETMLLQVAETAQIYQGEVNATKTQVERIKEEKSSMSQNYHDEFSRLSEDVHRLTAIIGELMEEKTTLAQMLHAALEARSCYENLVESTRMAMAADQVLASHGIYFVESTKEQHEE